MQDNYIFKTEDLILKVNKNYDHSFLKLDEWENYLECLCGNRYYQIEAIKNAIIYFASNKYDKIMCKTSERIKLIDEELGNLKYRQ